MRILLTDVNRTDSAEIESAALAAGHEVARCGPGPGDAACVGVAEDGTCPLARHADVAIDVRPDYLPRDLLSTGELGAVCAMRDGVPLLVVGKNPFGSAATTVNAEDALASAEMVARRETGRPPASLVLDQLRTALTQSGHVGEVSWVGYIDRRTQFDVVIELAWPLSRAARDVLDETVARLFWQARQEHRLGEIAYVDVRC